MISSEESSCAIYEMGNVELIEWKQTSETTQCLSCLKHALEGMIMCQCGKLLRPNKRYVGPKPSSIRSIESLELSYSLKGATKREKYTSIWDRWQNDEVYRVFQLARNWTDEHASTSTLSRTSISVMMQLIGKEHDTTTWSVKGDWKKNVLQSLPYSVFPIIDASICDVPWLSLNFVSDCLVGICLCAYESDCFVMLTLHWESLLIPTCFGESARQGRERFRRTFCWISLESATECERVWRFKRFSLFYSVRLCILPMIEWHVGGNLVGFSSNTHSKKLTLKTDSLWRTKLWPRRRRHAVNSLRCWFCKVQRTAIVPSSVKKLESPRHRRNLRGKQLENLTRQLGRFREPRVLRPFGRNRRQHCLPQSACAIFVHPKQSSPFTERLKLPYPDEEILSVYEEDVSFTRDGFTAWVKEDFETILERHVVDVRKALAGFRDASARRHDTSAQQYLFDSNVPKRSPVQKRLSIYNWNPEHRRGSEGAIEKQIGGERHIITLQEAIKYVDHELLTNRFHVTHNGRYAISFNKDTFFTDIKVKSIYLHVHLSSRYQARPARQGGWRRLRLGLTRRAITCLFSSTTSQRKKKFTVMSLHINNNYVKKRGIGKKLILTIRAVMLDAKVDLVAEDFNGAAWRCDNSNSISIIEEAFADCALPMPPSPTPLWGPAAVPGKWSDVCGFLKPPGFRWKLENSSARRILHEALGIRPTDQSCHHEAWLHLDFVGWRDEQPHREKHDRRILLKERSASFHYDEQKGHISDVMSDHSLSSWFGDHLPMRTTHMSSPSDLTTLRL